MKQSRISIYSIVLVLFCITNFLELFIPRMDEGNYFVRIPIQIIDGGLILLMWTSMLIKRNHWTPLTNIILLFISLILTYSITYFVFQKFNISDFAPYLRLLLWTTSLIFFYEMMIIYGINNKLMCIYTITFIASIIKKILEASMFESENLGGGDTAALPLLFIIPVILICFDNKNRVLLVSFVSILILFSLRRTAILGLAVCLPFIYKYISVKLKTHHIIIMSLIFTSLLFYAWQFIGEAVIYRFQNLLVGDSGGSKDSFGSGRSEFYMTVWKGWINADISSFIYGNGLTSVSKLLMRTHGIKHAHNDFLEIGYTFGLIGMCIWIIFIARLWNIKTQIKTFSPENLNLFYLCFISYLIIALASGCILRITTMPFAITISILLYKLQEGKTSILTHKKSEQKTQCHVTI